MEQLKILDFLPIVLTKDRQWAEEAERRIKPLRGGAVVLLPEDAILVKPLSSFDLK